MHLIPFLMQGNFTFLLGRALQAGLFAITPPYAFLLLFVFKTQQPLRCGVAAAIPHAI
jgi:hypothetical protein